MAQTGNGTAAERRERILMFRYAGTRAEILQLIADSETGGNLSELLRALADQKIEDRLRRKEKVA